MDHTVGGFDVGDNDLDGIVQVDLAILDSDFDILAQHSRGAGQVDHVRSHDLARDDMVKQDVGQFLFVLGEEQAVDGSGRQGSKSVIGGGKDSEGALAFERLDQASSLERSGQGGKAAVSNSG